MGKKVFKITAITIASLLGLLILLAVGYVLYVVIEYDRIEDNLILNIDNNKELTADVDSEFSLMTYNIGFGAYDRDFSFFMDKGEMLSGEKVSGKYGKAVSKDRVITNTDGALNIAKDNESDFYFFQEVDTDSSRSFHINQYEKFSSGLGINYGHNYGVNFHSAYLMYPFNDPHGKNNSGLATYSRFNISESVRRAYPLDTGFAKFFDLDRCFVITRIPLDNGKELTLINNHMSAYDKGGLIRAKQLEMLNTVMAEEYAKGNYVIVGGDFNHDIAGSKGLFQTQQKEPEWAYTLTDEDLTDNFKFAVANNTGTCRGADIPYTKGVNYEVVLDGFIVSHNVEVVSVSNIDTVYAYSDHNPVRMIFKLK